MSDELEKILIDMIGADLHKNCGDECGLKTNYEQGIKAIQALITDQMIEYQAQLLKDYKDDIAKECIEILKPIMKMADTKEPNRHVYDYCAMKLAALQEKNND